MVEPGLLFGAGMSLAGGAAFAYVGREVARRRLTGEERRANSSFVLWWYSLAGLNFVNAVSAFAGAFGFVDLALSVVWLHVALVVLCLSLWGLAYYLIYLYTGSARWLVPLGILYGAYYLLILYIVARAQPVGVEPGPWSVRIVYAHDLSGQPVAAALTLLLFGPQILGAFGYFSLIFRVDGAMQRYRIAVMAGAALFWFGSSIAASATGLSREVWWVPISRFIGVSAALLMLVAYRPPSWIRRRLQDPSTDVRRSMPTGAEEAP